MKKIIFYSAILFSFIANAQLTPPTTLQSYYSGVDFSLTGTQLFDDLATETISKHVNILEYFERHNYLYNADEDLVNSANVILMYNGESRDEREYESGSNPHSPQTFNTEHVYPQSLIVNNAKGDLHHLRSCDISINSSRLNNPFASGSGTYKDNGSSFYPGDEWKGDVARMIMYLNLRYNESFDDVGTLNLFLQWNAEDPVSDFEKQRNEIITAAQGNRNPFIDNPFIATVIWGGTAAQNTWGEQDTEAPTVPTNLSLSNITTATIDASWTASSDNVAVTKYEVFVDGNLNGETATTNYTVSGLNPNTTYAITVLAKDIANNKSAQTTAENGTTLTDTTPPTVPTNVTISNETGTSFKVNWNASTDNSSVTNYDVFLDGTLKGTSTTTTYTAIGLNSNTTYSVSVLARDSANNISSQSAAINGITTEPTSTCGAETFENMPANSSSYSNLTWTGDNGIEWNAVKSRTDQTLNGRAIAIALLRDNVTGSMTSSTFANGIGSLTASTMRAFSGGSGNLNILVNGSVVGTLPYDTAQQTTTISNINVEGNITIEISRAGSEEDRVIIDDLTWTCYSSTLSTKEENLNTFKIYPNPTNGNEVSFSILKDANVTIYNVLGKLVKSTKITQQKNTINISNFSKGIYLVKINSDGKHSTKKLILK